MQANINRNGILAEQYTSVEEWHNLNWNKKGKKTDDESAKYENVFVEGLPYRRQVAQNGKPLTGKAASKEQQRYDKAVEERKHMSMEQKSGFFHRTYHSDLPLNLLATLFDNQVTGEVMLNGRRTFVVKSTPKSDANPADPGQKSALNWDETTWIDEHDDMPARFDVVARKNMKLFRKGTSIRVDYELLPPRPGDPHPQPVWVQKDSIGQGWGKFLFIDRRFLTNQTWSDYKKFIVDVRLLPGSVKRVTP